MLRGSTLSYRLSTTTCTRILPFQTRTYVHSSTNGDISKFIPNVSVVDKTPSTALQPHRHQPTDQYKELLKEYSTQSFQRFAALKKRAANLAPVRHSENPQFVLQNKLFDEIVTDLSKYDLDNTNPYLLILESTTHEQRLDSQRVICALIKREIERNHIETAFDYFRLLQNSYLPVDQGVYTMLSDKIRDAFMELLANQTKTPSLTTLNTIMDYFTETDRLPEAFTLILSMKTAGIAPTEHTYQALLNACMRYEDTSDAMVAFDLMRADDIVLDYAYYDRLFQLCASSVYPLGAKTVLEEMCNRFKIPREQRWIHTLTLYITEFMKMAKIPQSERGRRGWVTAVSIQTKLVFPPKTNNNRLLEPDLGEAKEGLLHALSNCQYGLLTDSHKDVSPLPPLRALLEGMEKTREGRDEGEGKGMPEEGGIESVQADKLYEKGNARNL